MIFALGAFGLMMAHKYQFELRFRWVWASLAIVGFGSWLFHMTLVYEMQLMDELPMLFCSSLLLYTSIESGSKQRFGVWFPSVLSAIALGATFSYLYLNNPAIHHWSFGTISALVIFQSMNILYKLQTGAPQQGRRTARKLIGRGVFFYLLGFGLWNLDNLLCHDLRQLRNHLTNEIPSNLHNHIKQNDHVQKFFLSEFIPRALWAFSGIFQLHAWWHVLSGLGSYHVIMFFQWLRAGQGKFSLIKNSEEIFVEDERDLGESRDIFIVKGQDDSRTMIKVNWFLTVFPFFQIVPISTGWTLHDKK